MDACVPESEPGIHLHSHTPLQSAHREHSVLDGYFIHQLVLVRMTQKKTVSPIKLTVHTPQPVSEVVDACQDFLRQAKAGELRSVVIVGETLWGYTRGYWWDPDGPHHYSLLGATLMLEEEVKETLRTTSTFVPFEKSS